MTSTMDKLEELAIGFCAPLFKLTLFFVFLPVPPLMRGFAPDKCWFTLI